MLICIHKPCRKFWTRLVKNLSKFCSFSVHLSDTDLTMKLEQGHSNRYESMKVNAVIEQSLKDLGVNEKLTRHKVFATYGHAIPVSPPTRRRKVVSARTVISVPSMVYCIYEHDWITACPNQYESEIRSGSCEKLEEPRGTDPPTFSHCIETFRNKSYATQKWSEV